MAYQQLHYCPFHHVKMMIKELDGIEYLVCPNPLCRWGRKETDRYWWQLQDSTSHQVEEENEQTS